MCKHSLQLTWGNSVADTHTEVPPAAAHTEAAVSAFNRVRAEQCGTAPSRAPSLTGPVISSHSQRRLPGAAIWRNSPPWPIPNLSGSSAAATVTRTSCSTQPALLPRFKYASAERKTSRSAAAEGRAAFESPLHCWPLCMLLGMLFRVYESERGRAREGKLAEADNLKPCLRYLALRYMPCPTMPCMPRPCMSSLIQPLV